MRALGLVKGVKLPIKTIYLSLIRRLYTDNSVLPRKAGPCKSLLLIRTDAIGDFVLFTPALKHIRRIFSNYKIILLVNRQAFELASTCPYVDEVIPCCISRYRRNFFYRVALIRSLRRRAFDLAVHPIYSRSAEGDEILYSSGAAQRIGFDGDLNNISAKLKAQNDPYYTRLVKIGTGVNLELERNRLFVEQVTGAEVDPANFVPELWINTADRSASLCLLRAAGLETNRDSLVALIPGAMWEGRMWPAGNYARLADRLAEDYGLKTIICGSLRDAPLARAVAARMKMPSPVFTGQTTLGQLAALLGLCALCIGNETGPLHMAIAMGTPTLCIMGGGHFGRFYPHGDLKKHRMVFKKMDCYNCNWQCIYETTRCIEEVSLDDVWRAAQQLMEEVVLPRKKRQHKEAAACEELRP